MSVDDSRTDGPGDLPPGLTPSACRALRRGAVSPKRFLLYREQDATGVSGTGVVATGVVWPDGHAALRWKADDHEAASSTSVWSSVADLMRVHGHGGLSKLLYLDEDADRARGRAVESYV